MNLFRDKRVIIAGVAILVGLFVNIFGGNFVTENTNSSISTTFPATSCPSSTSGMTSVAYLPSSSHPIRTVKSGSNKFVNPKASSYILNKATLLDSSPSTTLINSFNAQAAALTLCTSGVADEWFVGSSGALPSQSELHLVNSGLSESTVDLFLFTSAAALPVTSIKVPANSEKVIAIDTLAPGENSVVIHAITRSGRVTTFLYEHRQKGLKSLGSDYINPSVAPSKTLVIPAATNNLGKGRKVTQVLRILAPGKVDANVTVNIVASDGSFIPYGLENRNIGHEKTIDIPLADLATKSIFSLAITADQPVVASIFTSSPLPTGNDFAWGPAASPLPASGITMNLGGLSPAFVFSGESVNVEISWRGVGGKTGHQTLTGQGFVAWAPPVPLSRIQITTDQAKNYGGFVLALKGRPGIAYLALTSGSTLESSSIPIPDARVINRG